jgi:hypothetical protein
MGLDEVGTARILREHRKVTDALVATHGGRLVKTTGDGVFLEFPSVVDAVECAVAVQAVMAERNNGVPVPPGYSAYPDYQRSCTSQLRSFISRLICNPIQRSGRPGKVAGACVMRP